MPHVLQMDPRTNLQQSLVISVFVMPGDYRLADTEHTVDRPVPTMGPPSTGSTVPDHLTERHPEPLRISNSDAGAVYCHIVR